MKDVKDFLDLAGRAWSWITQIGDWNSPMGVLGRIAIFLLVIAIVLFLAVTIAEWFVRLQEASKKLGLSIYLSAERRQFLRRRQQFCEVLAADLTALAKAENWNDQYFTDLEAEIEAEGNYYLTHLQRRFRRPCKGIRRLPSLMKAIQSSGEQFLVLAGEPGTGKSVALRHLARQLSDRAGASRDVSLPIPLYVNLREFAVPGTGSRPTADAVKQFVLDNVRRGDADTAAYVREHWDEYRALGRWFFLLDSFDEIPDVMHAAAGDKALEEYAQAIRTFLEGMSSCRGIVASREFRRPPSLSWPVMRILALSESRQEELIHNSFLPDGLKSLVRQHLAGNQTLHRNPLFLTLFCRYVRELKRPPSHDHDLLLTHLRRLAGRDPDYLLRKYGLHPDGLIDGATQLAVCFAEDQALGLAPTRKEVASRVRARRLSITASLEQLLPALVDVKIGRSDVQEARPGDQRFAFAHRRYQEALFASHLAAHPLHIPVAELFTDPRWREYVVTLLQTADAPVVAALLRDATAVLQALARDPPARTRILPHFGGHLSYGAWHKAPFVQMLLALQEGLSRRRDLRDDGLLATVGEILSPLWDHGDILDRSIVLEVSGLAPERDLVERISFAIDQGSDEMRRVALERVQFLRKVPDGIAAWVRSRLSHETILARGPGALRTLEALSARLPSHLGADFVFRRCARLRSSHIVRSLIHAAHSQLQVLTRLRRRRGRSSFEDGRDLAFQFAAFSLWYVLTLVTITATSMSMRAYRATLSSPLLSAAVSAPACSALLAGLLSVALLQSAVLFLCRTHGGPLTVAVAATALSLKVRRFARGDRLPIRSLLGALLVTTLPGILWTISLSWRTGHLPGNISDIAISSFAGSSVFIAGLFSVMLVKEEAGYRRALDAAIRDSPEGAILRARSPGEFEFWLGRASDRLLPTLPDARSVSRIILARKATGHRESSPLEFLSWPGLSHRLLARYNALVAIHIEALLQRNAGTMSAEGAPPRMEVRGR